MNQQITQELSDEDDERAFVAADVTKKCVAALQSISAELNRPENTRLRQALMHATGDYDDYSQINALAERFNEGSGGRMGSDRDVPYVQYTPNDQATISSGPHFLVIARFWQRTPQRNGIWFDVEHRVGHVETIESDDGELICRVVDLSAASNG